MAETVPSGLLEACVVLGVSNERLKELALLQGEVEEPLVEAEVLQVHAPPFVTKESSRNATQHFSRAQRRRSFKKKREQPVSTISASNQTKEPVVSGSDDLSVPQSIDLIALPQLCFPDGLRITGESREDYYHFLVFTDVFGNQTHGVVAQYCRPVHCVTDNGIYQNGLRLNKLQRLFTTYSICIISKYPYYNALRDCLSSFLLQLKTSRMCEFEEQVKEFSAKLALVPIPPPGPLHVVFNLRPFQIELPSRLDVDRPVMDLDLHLPFLCFKPKQILQIIISILMEQRVVFLSTDWARLTLFAECFMIFIHPLRWQHPFVPVLSRQMLDFIMAPTAFLMGCHTAHFKEVAEELDDLVVIDLDQGTVLSSISNRLELPDVPLTARDCFIFRGEGLQLHYDLDVCCAGSRTDINELRAHRRQWQHKVNTVILNITMELIVNIFSEVCDFLNYEHRVFNSEEFLRSREATDHKFYKKVLDTHIFHSFLRDRLNRKNDAFTRMQLNIRSETRRMRALTESPHRPMMEGICKYVRPENGLNSRLGVSMPNLADHRLLAVPVRQTSMRTMPFHSGSWSPSRPIKTFKLPEFPPPLAYQYVQSYYNDLIKELSKAISTATPDDSALLARYYYLRGLVNSVAGKRVDALGDFQSLYKTDMDIFPAKLLNVLVESLPVEERRMAERRPDLNRLISQVKRENERERARPIDDGTVKRFELPKKHLHMEDFVQRVQESGIVKDQGTIQRLFEALTVGQQKQVDPETFCFFYNFWKETEAAAQDVDLPVVVLEHLVKDECVYKLSSSVKTSHGVGKIAMTQRRLFLLTEGRPGYVEITKFRDIEDVKISSTPFLLLRIPTLKITTSLRKETFEANLKSECDLWHLMIKEMWAGRKMADEHKDPQFMEQALTNALLMDAVVGCLQSQKAIFAATKLAYFDKKKLEVPMMVPKTTSETLKHKINPSLDQTSPQAVDVLLYTPGQLSVSSLDGGGNPKLWCALSNGKVLVFDAASWSMQKNSVQVGKSRLNCMLAVNQQQLWIGSKDSFIYIINPRSVSCNKQLTEHRCEVTGLALEERTDKFSQTLAYSCSEDGSVIVWDVSTLQVRRQFRVSCHRLQSVQIHTGMVWCCGGDCVLEVRRNGTVHRKVSLPDHLLGSPRGFSCFLLFNESEQLWTGLADAGELCVCDCRDLNKPFIRIQLKDCTGVVCMIRVKNQIWVGCQGKTRGKIYVVNTERYTVEKELMAHDDSVQTLCSAEDRYVLSGAARADGKIGIWKVE
ncbi:DENN domain-containing protein 3 isoform X2 [Carassius gibelio]|uniref:DENN domain-containing protein 3 isoform X2 n=1 Tax=Carassius gibelio TaxID=101364 RepID=UPI002279B786|nr:DENN domain-containing protein 3 isoform X2 [Carassius gibelio]XP_052440326.1 DENN domain-containing protein 3 isoform X2 [Carassius gibelio]